MGNGRPAVRRRRSREVRSHAAAPIERVAIDSSWSNLEEFNTIARRDARDDRPGGVASWPLINYRLPPRKDTGQFGRRPRDPQEAADMARRDRRTFAAELAMLMGLSAVLAAFTGPRAEGAGSLRVDDKGA
jgi:hypothetical protein